MNGRYQRSRGRATRLRPSSLNVLACQTLLAVVVHSAGKAGDDSFFNGSWFRRICGMLGWNAAWVRDKVEDVGVVSDLHIAGYKRDRGPRRPEGVTA